MVTIEDVAKKAETSIATVSRVLNNQTGFSEKTKQRVLAVVEELDYESNAIARSLKKQKTNTIGVLVPNVSSMLSNEILNGIEEYASEHEYSVLTSYTYSDPKKVMKSLRTFNEQRIDGLIFVSDFFLEEYYDYIKSRKIPTVLTATENKEFPFSFIKVNDFQASYDAVSYLLEEGHREVGMLSIDPVDHPIAGGDRLRGYKEALTDTGIEVKDGNIVFSQAFAFEEGRSSFKTLMEQNPELTAIFAGSDELAVGALNMANELNIKVPEQVSIIGYDNLPISKMVWPAVATVAQPLKEMGYESAKELVKQMKHPEKDNVYSYINHKIVKRKSVKTIK